MAKGKKRTFKEVTWRFRHVLGILDGLSSGKMVGEKKDLEVI